MLVQKDEDGGEPGRRQARSWAWSRLALPTTGCSQITRFRLVVYEIAYYMASGLSKSTEHGRWYGCGRHRGQSERRNF
jgi:hypothetical protein